MGCATAEEVRLIWGQRVHSGLRVSRWILARRRRMSAAVVDGLWLRPKSSRTVGLWLRPEVVGSDTAVGVGIIVGLVVLRLGLLAGYRSSTSPVLCSCRGGYMGYAGHVACRSRLQAGAGHAASRPSVVVGLWCRSREGLWLGGSGFQVGVVVPRRVHRVSVPFTGLITPVDRVDAL